MQRYMVPYKLPSYKNAHYTTSVIKWAYFFVTRRNEYIYVFIMASLMCISRQMRNYRNPLTRCHVCCWSRGPRFSCGSRRTLWTLHSHIPGWSRSTYYPSVLSRGTWAPGRPGGSSFTRWSTGALWKDTHDNVIKWKLPRYWPFVKEIRRSPVNSLHRGQWRGSLMFSLIRAWTKSRVNNCSPGDLQRHRAYYDVIVTAA